MSAITITVTGNEEIPSLPIAVQDAFNIDTAEGVQLDVLGKYIGISRNGYDFNGPITLDDSDYRIILKIKILENSLPSDLSTIQNFLYTNFGGDIEVFDYQDMTMAYLLYSGAISNELAQFFIKAGLLPKPMGVLLRATVLNPTTYYFFGFRTYDAVAFHQSGFNTYDSYSMTAPWLNYDYAII